MIHLFIPAFVCAFAHYSFVHSLIIIHTFARTSSSGPAFMPSLLPSFVHLIIRVCVHVFVHAFVCAFTHPYLRLVHSCLRSCLRSAKRMPIKQNDGGEASAIATIDSVDVSASSLRPVCTGLTPTRCIFTTMIVQYHRRSAWSHFTLKIARQ